MLQANSGGMCGGGGVGSGGGGLGNGCCGALANAASFTELIVPGPQSVLSVRNPQTCVIWPIASVMKTDGLLGV